MIVVDTNVIVYLFVEGTYTAQARRVFLRDPQWCVPQLWLSEFRNVLALYMRNEGQGADRAVEMLREAEELVKGREYRVSSADVVALLSESTCSAYDCEFVALAEHLEVPLVTTDRKVLKAFPDTALTMGAFLG